MHGLAFAPMGNGSFPTIKLARTALLWLNIAKQQISSRCQSRICKIGSIVDTPNLGGGRSMMIRAVLFLTIVSGSPAINAVAAYEDQWDRQLRRQRMEEWEQWRQRQDQQQIERQEQLDRIRRDLDQGTRAAVASKCSRSMHPGSSATRIIRTPAHGSSTQSKERCREE
jgi:hypothetical protein